MTLVLGLAAVVKALSTARRRPNTSPPALQSERDAEPTQPGPTENSTSRQINLTVTTPKDKLQAAILALGLIIASLQVLLLWRQNTTISRQTEIMDGQAASQRRLQEQQDAIQHTVGWNELQNVIGEIMAQYPEFGVESLRQLSAEDKRDWAKRVRKLLDSQIGNPVLVQDRSSLLHWQMAISVAKFSAFVDDDPESQTSFIEQAAFILDEVKFVGERLRIKSREFYPSVGRPQPTP